MSEERYDLTVDTEAVDEAVRNTLAALQRLATTWKNPPSKASPWATRLLLEIREERERYEALFGDFRIELGPRAPLVEGMRRLEPRPLPPPAPPQPLPACEPLYRKEF